MNHISGAIGFSRSAGDKWALEGRIARSLSSGVTVSTVNSAAMKLLDYAIVPRIWLTPNSRLHIRSFWSVVAASGSATLNIQLNQAGYDPPGGGSGYTLIMNTVKSNGEMIYDTIVQLRNSLHAQISGQGGNGAVLSTYDFESHDVEICFAAANPSASSSVFTALLGFNVEVLN